MVPGRCLCRWSKSLAPVDTFSSLGLSFEHHLECCAHQAILFPPEQCILLEERPQLLHGPTGGCSWCFQFGAETSDTATSHPGAEVFENVSFLSVTWKHIRISLPGTQNPGSPCYGSQKCMDSRGSVWAQHWAGRRITWVASQRREPATGGAGLRRGSEALRQTHWHPVLFPWGKNVLGELNFLICETGTMTPQDLME